MPDDTQIGGPQARFPTTRWSAVNGVAGSDPEERGRAFGAIVGAYWKPVYKHIRIKWQRSNEEAKDLTQGFFAEALAKRFFDAYDPGKARFRTFLRICVDRYVSNEGKAATRLKRGGGAQIVSLDFNAAEHELACAGPTAADEDRFDREWVRSLFGLAVEALREHCLSHGKQVQFQIFQRYDLRDDADPRPTYAELAAEYGIAPTDVTNFLAYARREYRRLVLAKLQEITAGDEEFRSEARCLLGVDPT